MPLIALIGGGDWSDASVCHLVVTDDMDIVSEKKLYRDWYAKIYLPELKMNGQPHFMSFERWLLDRGAKNATENDILIVDDV